MSNATNNPSAAAHTPGPWVVGGTLVSNGNQTIARVLWRDDRHEGVNDYDRQAPRDVRVTEANAALIARAPDLAAENAALQERLGALRVALARAIDTADRAAVMPLCGSYRATIEGCREVFGSIAKSAGEALRADEGGQP